MSLIDEMKKLGVPITRENFIKWNWMFDQPPEEPLDPDIEAAIMPEELSTFPKDSTEE